MSSDEQAQAYFREATLTLESARAIHESVSDANQLWAQVVKNSYDAVEQAASAGIADCGQLRSIAVGAVVYFDSHCYLERRTTAFMSDVKLARARVEPGKVDLLRAWYEELQERESEVVETLRHEGVCTETAFIQSFDDGTSLYL